MNADSSRAFWPVDWVVVSYYAASGVVIACLYHRVPAAGWLLALNAAAPLLVWLATCHPGRASFLFRHWYPLPYVALCYREISILIPAMRSTEADAALAHLDYSIWGASLSLWLERLSTPALTEFLQIAYSLFVPAVLLIAFLLWSERRYAEFRYYAFLIALGFLVSYIGYVLVPARGPRFFPRHLETTDLRGWWFTAALRTTLDRLETRAWDCFPSGHTELTLLALWGSRWISERLFWIYLAYTVSIVSATVYLRYHYTIDVLAGAAVAVLLLLFAPYLYRALRPSAI